MVTSGDTETSEIVSDGSENKGFCLKRGGHNTVEGENGDSNQDNDMKPVDSLLLVWIKDDQFVTLSGSVANVSLDLLTWPDLHGSIMLKGVSTGFSVGGHICNQEGRRRGTIKSDLMRNKLYKN